MRDKARSLSFSASSRLVFLDRCFFHGVSRGAGASGSGKSTIAKQMKLLYMDGYTAEERQSFKNIIHDNIMTGMRTLLSAALSLGYPIDRQVTDVVVAPLSF